MKNKIFCFLILLIPYFSQAQFEQKVSLSFAAGTFKTFGNKTYRPEWGVSAEDDEPTQMPNYKPGLFISQGFQFNINRRLSLMADYGVMYSGKWYYKIYEENNYLDWAIYDSITDELIKEGSDELNFLNICIGVAPKYYLLEGKKWNPFIYAGITFNYTKSTFEDRQYEARKQLNILSIEDSPSDPYLEKSFGLGLLSGIGLEYLLTDKLGFYASASYYNILLNKNNFKTEEQRENFHSLTLQAGIRFSFIKSKDL